jgi:hypothetical protein
MNTFSAFNAFIVYITYCCFLTPTVFCICLLIDHYFKTKAKYPTNINYFYHNKDKNIQD